MDISTVKKYSIYFIFFLLLTGGLIFAYENLEKLIKIASPFFMAVVISYIMNPLVKRLVKRGFKSQTSIIILYVIFLAAATVTVVFIIPELVKNTRELSVTIPEIGVKYQAMIDAMLSAIRSSDWSEDFKNTIFKEVQNTIQTAQELALASLKKIFGASVKVVTTLLDLLLALVIAYYLIKDADFFKNLILSIVPRRWRNGLINTGREINLILSNFIQGQLLTALIVGILETIGLLIVNVKYSLILGMTGGIANIIPYFGPILGAFPAVAVALIDSPAKALKTIAVFIIIQQIDNSFISPKIIEGRLGLHPVTTIIAVLAGGEFFGILGMLVAVPVLAIIKVLFKRAVETIVE